MPFFQENVVSRSKEVRVVMKRSCMNKKTRPRRWRQQQVGPSRCTLETGVWLISQSKEQANSLGWGGCACVCVCVK